MPAGSGEQLWLSLLEHVILPAARSFQPQLVLISAGFDAHRSDPLAGCELQSSSFAQMACHVRDFAASVGAPVGAVLEGGYQPQAAAECLCRTLAALDGEGEAIPAPPERLLTPRAAAQVGRYWPL